MRTRYPFLSPAVARSSKGRDWLPLLFLGGLFLGGAYCGRAMYRTIGEDTASALMLLLSGSAGESGPFLFFPSWAAVFATNLLFMAVLFLCGFCAVGQPLILLAPFFKGLGFGLVAACNAAQFSPYSAFFWLNFMPGAFLATALLLLCAKQSLLMSVAVFRAVFYPDSRQWHGIAPPYFMKYLLFAALCGLFSLMDTVFDLLYTILSTV